MKDQSAGETPRRNRWDRAAIIEALSEEGLNVTYRAAVIKLAREVLGEVADEKGPSPERDKLVGLEGMMNILHEDLLSLGDKLDSIHYAIESGEILVDRAV